MYAACTYGVLRLRWLPVSRTASPLRMRVASVRALLKLCSQLHYCCAGSAFVLRGFSYFLHVWVLLQVLTQSLTEDSHAAAVDYANAGKAGEESAVDELFDFAGSVIDGVADYVDF